FFRPPNNSDIDALEKSEERLKAKWETWDAIGLIPTEEIPTSSNYNRGHRLYGVTCWHEMFTPRQLLGHLTLVEHLGYLASQIRTTLDPERAKAVITYLQFAMDKGLDYNSKYTRWEYTRGVIKGTFSLHNFSLKWIFG